MALDEPPALFSTTSVTSLAFVGLICGITYTLSAILLPSRTTPKLRCLFLWHAFDCIVHFTLEASFLFSCIAYSAPAPLATGISFNDLPRLLAENPPRAPFTPAGAFFLGDSTRLRGAFYGDTPMAKVWQEYARADRRWGGADLGVISLEILTVFVMAPLSVLACYYIVTAAQADASAMTTRSGTGRTTQAGNRQMAAAYFWMLVVATGELYGGFMTFAPEWLSGNTNLDSSNWMFLWLYLVFFNMLWVWIPAWVLWEGWKGIVRGAVDGVWEIRVGAQGRVAEGRKAK